MVRTIDCITKYGQPSAKSKYLTLYDIPIEYQIETFPKRLFVNKDLIEPLTTALLNIKIAGIEKQIKTFDGCFNIRKARGTNTWSLHSWAIAIDINAFENKMGTKGNLSTKLVKCFKDAGFDWGGDWIKRIDPMHFQLSKI